MNFPTTQNNRQLQPDEFPFSQNSDSDINAPFEFSVFERIEAGLDEAHSESAKSKQVSKESSSEKFAGPKEVIFVSGWVDVQTVFHNYLQTFYVRVILGLTLLFCLLKNDQDFLPLAIVSTGLALAQFLKHLFLLARHWSAPGHLRFIYWVEFQLSLGFLLAVLGFALVLGNYLRVLYLPLFIFPYLLVSFGIFMLKSDDNAFLAQKNYCLIEALQFMMLTLKLLDPNIMNWNVTLVFLMTSAIYLTTLGLLLMVILSCALFGFMYRRLEKWKLRSLAWMTFYYLFTGIAYIYVVKGSLDFFHDGDVILQARIHSYVGFHSNDTELLQTAALMLVVCNFAFLLMGWVWAEDIKKYLARIIFKKDLRKEVSLRRFKDSFAFRVVQFSSVFFKRPDESGSKCKQGEPKKLGDEDCFVCYSAKPNVMQEPCGHGGMCKECCLEYIKHEQKCMVCRRAVNSILVIEQEQDTLDFHAVGQIKLKV